MPIPCFSTYTHTAVLAQITGSTDIRGVMCASKMSRRCNGGPSFFGILLLSTCLLLAWLPRSSWSSSSNYVNAESVGRPGAGGAGTTTTEAVDLLSQYEQLSNSSLRWMQRPNLYYGMRARVQGDSPLFGLMWFGIHDYGGFNSELGGVKLRGGSL